MGIKVASPDRRIIASAIFIDRGVIEDYSDSVQQSFGCLWLRMPQFPRTAVSVHRALEKDIQNVSHRDIGYQQPTNQGVGIGLDRRRPLFPVLLICVVRGMCLHVRLRAVPESLVFRCRGN